MGNPPFPGDKLEQDWIVIPVEVGDGGRNAQESGNRWLPGNLPAD
jgi:hypothetical protein